MTRFQLRMNFILLLLAATAMAQTKAAPAVDDTTLANQYFAEGVILSNKFKLDSADVLFEKAAILYRQAAQRYEQPRLWAQFVYSNLKIGFRLSTIGQGERALTYLTPALEVGLKKLGEGYYHISTIYSTIGDIYKGRAEYGRAMEYYNKVFEIKRRLYGENHIEVAGCYQKFGLTYYTRGDFDAAIKYYNQSLSILGKLPEANHAAMAHAYNVIGLSYSVKGDLERGLKFQKMHLEALLKVLPEKHPLVAQAYGNIGMAFFSLGDYDTALEYCQRAAAIFEQTLGNSYPNTARAYEKIGGILSKKNKLDEAIANHRRALELNLHLPGDQQAGIATSYDNLGSLYLNKGDYAQALDFFNKSLEIKHRLYGENYTVGSSCEITHENLGSLYSKTRAFELAIDHFNKALSVAKQAYPEKNPTIAHLNHKLAEVFQAQGDLNKATQFYQKAIVRLVANFADSNVYHNPALDLVSSKETLLLSLEAKAQTLARIFQNDHRRVTELHAALSTYELASDLIDKMRSGYEAESSKLIWGETASKIYEKALQFLCYADQITKDTRYKQESFNFAEKGKARVLALSLHEARVKRFLGIPRDLLEKESDLKIDLAFYETAIEQEKSKTGNSDQEKLRKFQERYFVLKRDYVKFMSRLEKSFPQYYVLKYKPQITTLANLQAALNEETAVLEYFVGDTTIFAFAITRGNFKVITIKNDSSFKALAASFAQSFKNVASKSAYLQDAVQLYRVLVQPLTSGIIDKPQWVIIPDGELYQIPFEALLAETVAPQNDADYRALPYLLKQHEISYHYSATLFLKSLQENRAGSYANLFAGFAPVFDAAAKNGVIYRSDPEDSSAIALIPKADSTFLATRDGKTLEPLLYSAQEVQDILATFPDRSRAFLQQEASEENFKQQIKGYKYVHLATHGRLVETNPKLSNLTFSQPQNSKVKEDGILYSAETYNLDLNADLLVLSACQTGAGQIVKGEGLMGLTRGFLYSGARNIVASLWKVYDRHTSLLMVEMYRQIAAGKSYSAALREAKLKMIANAETAAPQSWAGFVLIGR